MDSSRFRVYELLLMISILHCLKDPKLWEYGTSSLISGECRIYINCSSGLEFRVQLTVLGSCISEYGGWRLGFWGSGVQGLEFRFRRASVLAFQSPGFRALGFWCRAQGLWRLGLGFRAGQRIGFRVQG